MAGIYIHIPFCKQACHYCNFHFSTSLKRKNDFTRALLKEVALRGDYLGGVSDISGSAGVDTIYFGGGTPSLLDPGELNEIMTALRATFPVSPDAEITLEANPDDINTHGPEGRDRLRSWRELGINRLSIGIQSFFDEDLRWMHRAHSAAQSVGAVRLAQEAGFDNLSLDLIYGGPTLPDANWEANLDQALALGVPHLSCYALTVEPKTALEHRIRQKRSEPVDPDRQARQFLLLLDRIENVGFEQYEISNFCRPGHRSRHNSAYWKKIPYLGLGPSAHSFDGARSRQWNIADNTKYIDALERGALLFEREELTPVQQLNEYIMISLRTVEGCDMGLVAKQFGERAASELMRRTEQYLDRGLLARLGAGSIVLTREGKFLADGIASDLFFEPAWSD